MNVGSLLNRLATDLNDAAPGHEFTTWSREQLGAYLEEAIQLAFVERPDLFIEERVVKVEPCVQRQPACDCTRVRRVLGQCTPDGRVLHPLRPRQVDDRLVWTGRSCPSNPKNFKLTQYAIDDSADALWVWPAVPAGIDVYVLVECAVMPQGIDESYEIPVDLQAAVVQWALYRARMVDAENNSAVFEVAKEHAQQFWGILVLSSDTVEDFERSTDPLKGVSYANTSSSRRVRSTT